MIGVFDSGIGGLTVMRELLRELPECGFVYLGDTARMPYGSKSPETIQRYSREDAQLLMDHGARVIVVACNTASALAADSLRHAFPNVPIIEVVTPAVELAVAATRNGRIGVIGTRATIASGVYEREITKRWNGQCFSPSQREGEREGVGTFAVHAQPCPLLVPLVEEGWLDHSETTSIIRTYLKPLQAASVDVLILGCTHYPLLESFIEREMSAGVTIVNPARAVARLVRERLDHDPTLAMSCRGTDRSFFLTDRTPHFEHIASAWLGIPIGIENVIV